MKVPAGPICPLTTREPHSLQEAAEVKLPDIRAYKLGKKRWSYNQVELILCEDGGLGRQLNVKVAQHIDTLPHSPRLSYSNGVLYEITLFNDEKLLLEVYLVYDSPKQSEGKNSEWTLVDRTACQRNCSGPVLRAIQRFGRLGKRSWSGSPSPDTGDKTLHNMKDQRYMYLSFDEAGTHVGWKNFRLVAGAKTESGVLLGSAASPSFRVFANNDVPTGSAQIQLFMALPSDWNGWDTVISFPTYQAREAAILGDLSFAANSLPSGGNNSNNDVDDDPYQTAFQLLRKQTENDCQNFGNQYLNMSKRRALGTTEETTKITAGVSGNSQSNKAPCDFDEIANAIMNFNQSNGRILRNERNLLQNSKVKDFDEYPYFPNLKPILQNHGKRELNQPVDVEVENHSSEKELKSLQHNVHEQILSMNGANDDPVASFVEEMLDSEKHGNMPFPYHEEQFDMINVLRNDPNALQFYQNLGNPVFPHLNAALGNIDFTAMRNKEMLDRIVAEGSLHSNYLNPLDQSQPPNNNMTYFTLGKPTNPGTSFSVPHMSSENMRQFRLDHLGYQFDNPLTDNLQEIGKRELIQMNKDVGAQQESENTNTTKTRLKGSTNVDIVASCT